jgi:hypothetical protein
MPSRGNTVFVLALLAMADEIMVRFSPDISPNYFSLSL